MGGVLAFDLAPGLCGYCVGDGYTVPTATAWRFPALGDDFGALGLAMARWARTLIREHRPALVVYEAPILLSHDKLENLRRIYGLDVVLEMVCVEEEVPCSEVSHRTIKHRMTGDQFAEKKAVVAAVRRLGIPLPNGIAEGQQDAADAAGAWLVGMMEIDGAAASPWFAKVAGLLL